MDFRYSLFRRILPIGAALVVVAGCRGAPSEEEPVHDEPSPTTGTTGPVLCKEYPEADSACRLQLPDLVLPRHWFCWGGGTPPAAGPCTPLGSGAFCCDRPQSEWPVATVDVDDTSTFVAETIVAVHVSASGVWTLSFSCDNGVTTGGPCGLEVVVHTDGGALGDPTGVVVGGPLTTRRLAPDTVILGLSQQHGPGESSASFAAPLGATLEMTGTINGERAKGLFVFLSNKKLKTDVDYTNPILIRAAAKP